MKNYSYRKGFSWSVDVQLAGEYLENLKKENEDFLVPAIIVENAKSKKNILHDCFEWDDEKAGYQHRLQKARNLLGSIEIEVLIEGKKEKVRNFLHVKVEENEKIKLMYVTLQDSLKNEQCKEYIMDKFKAEILALTDRYKIYSHLAGHIVSLLDIMELLKKK